MPKLKAEFRKPKLTLYNTNYEALGVLTNRTHLSAHNIVLNTQVNETPTLTFDIPAGGLINSNSTELLVKHKNDYFVIKEISISDSDATSISVSAEHTACELKGILSGYFDDLIGKTPQDMWNTIVKKSTMKDVIRNRYVLETNIVNTYRYLAYDDEKSLFEYLVSIAQQFDSCLLFETDGYGVTHIGLLHGDINRNRFIRKGKDLKQLDLKFNTESLFTKLTPFGATDDDGVEVNIMGVNKKSYITDFSYYLAKGMTQAQIDENPLCNQECVYRNDEIFDESELLRLAKEELKRVSTPVVEGSISAIDLHVFEGSLYLSPILCERIIVVDKDIDYSLSCKITSISFNYDNPLESQIGISNVIKYSSTLKDLVTNGNIIDRVTTNGLNGKLMLSASKVHGIIDGHIAQLKYSMEDKVTDITDAVILFENRIVGDDMFGALAIGSRGVLISRQLDKVTNQWVWTTALDAKGLSTQVVSAVQINGSQIRGDIISSYDDSTWINLNDGSFNFKDRVKYADGKFSIIMKADGTTTDEFLEEYEKDINDVYGTINTLRNDIDTVISDNIIDEAELLIIKNTMMQLDKEKEDIGTAYTTLYNNDELTSAQKDDLKTAYNAYISAHDSFKSAIDDMVADGEATEQEKAVYDTAAKTYSTTLANFNKVATLSIELASNNYVDAQVEVLNDSISLKVSGDEMEKYMGDNYYTKADTDAQIQITADSITNTVSSTYVHKNVAYNLQTQIAQNANNISTKVSSGEFSTLFNQNAKAFDFTIGSSSGMNVRIDRDGIKVKNGGLQVTNSNGTTIIDGSSNIFKIHTIYEVLLDPGSNLSYNYYINHNLGYVPAYAAFQVDSQSSMGTSNTLLPALNVGRGDSCLEFVGIIRCNASSSQIIINYERASTSVIAQVRVKVFVYKERLI